MKFDPETPHKGVHKDQTDYGELRGNLVSDLDQDYIVDSMLIKGVSVNRDENDCNYDYVLLKDRDHLGMRFYQHKYFSGYQHYYQHLAYKQQLERINEIENKLNAEEQKGVTDEMFEKRQLEHDTREITNKIRKKMNDLTMRMFIRTTICFKDIGTFQGKDMSKLYGDKYSGNHIAIFECELKAPPQLAFIDHTYDDYINAYRMNFKNWKIVDIDNFMQGNHYFNEIQEQSVWDQKVKNTLGPSPTLWKQNEASSPLFAREILFPAVDKVAQDIAALDTNSNFKMSPLHKQREQEIELARQQEALAIKEKATKKEKGEKKKATAEE